MCMEDERSVGGDGGISTPLLPIDEEREEGRESVEC